MRFFDYQRGNALTRRELEIIVALAEGKTIKEMALEWKLSAKTIHHEKSLLFGKLGATTAAHAVALWLTARYEGGKIVY